MKGDETSACAPWDRVSDGARRSGCPLCAHWVTVSQKRHVHGGRVPGVDALSINKVGGQWPYYRGPLCL